MGFNEALGKLLGNDKKFEEIIVDERVIKEITQMATESDPKEFMALLSGKIEDLKLKINGFIFLPFEASDTSAVMEIFMMPLKTDSIGSVHSHPGPSAQPSSADLRFFEKNGIFHMIICRPYNEYAIKAYDAFGTPVPYTVADLGDEVEIGTWDDLDVDDEFFDDDLLKELEELEKKEPEEQDDKIDNKDKSNDTVVNIVEDNNIIQQPTPSITMQIENNGKIIEKTIPLPQSYKEGDDIVIDIRTDEPYDNIDNVSTTVMPEKHEFNEDLTQKSSEEVEKEISMMESNIEEIKKENQRLVEEMKKDKRNNS